VIFLEPKPVKGIVKGCKVVCEPDILKEYGEGDKIIVVSEKRFSTLLGSLSEMEDDLLKLKELNLSGTLNNIKDMRKKIELNLMELSYSEYLD
jgi:hypothetical protein